MKAWTGALIAVLTIGLIVFGLGMRPQPSAMSAAAARPADAAQAPTLVNCGPGQQALVRQVVLADGRPASQVDCVGVAGASTAYTSQPAYAAQAAYTALAYPAAQVPTVADDDLVTAPRVVRSETPRASTRRVAERPRRSWGKTALVIGGSTAAGAGVGGIIAGKKGALIGAAIGGGASTIYEAVKR